MCGLVVKRIVLLQKGHGRWRYTERSGLHEVRSVLKGKMHVMVPHCDGIHCHQVYLQCQQTQMLKLWISLSQVYKGRDIRDALLG
jgi:hypothetical protein